MERQDTRTKGRGDSVPDPYRRLEKGSERRGSGGFTQRSVDDGNVDVNRPGETKAGMGQVTSELYRRSRGQDLVFILQVS